MDLLIINFDKTAPYQMLFGRLRIRQRYNLMKRSRNDTFRLLALSGTHHRMSLTTSCLSIREYRSVISLQDIVY